MRIIKIPIYKFNELKKEAKERVLEEFRYCNVGDGSDDWAHNILDKWKTNLQTAGFLDCKIKYFGFGSQGDGASFTCSKMNLKSLNKTYGLGFKESFLTVVENYLDSAKVIRTGHSHCHENTCATYIYMTDGRTHITKKLVKFEEAVERIRISVCKDIYSELRVEYERLTSDDCVIEHVLDNYEFEKDGELWLNH
jgi:hypothetical protein